MKDITFFLIGLLMLLSPVSCVAPSKIVLLPAPKQTPLPAPRQNLFVLLSDPDGRTGQIVVENKGGSQLIDKPGYVAEVKDAATPPAVPHPMDEKEIARIFGKALAAQPEPPVLFILNFKIGSAELTEESIKKIPEIFATISARKSSDISVVGHSDTVGPKKKNYEISFNRAQKVKELLVSRGIDPQAVITDSHGEDNLLVKTADEVAEPKNRRVEVTIR
jgi:outer membrane protein OmpA-like peptidoglycan-associated protein